MENIVLDKLNEIIQLLQHQEPKKADFIPMLQDLDNLFVEEFKDVSEPPERMFFRYNEDEHLSEIERKMDLLKTNPECCLLEAVKYCENKMHRFLDKYHIGFAKEFYLIESGTFFVKLSCMITSIDSFHQETATKELKEQFQLDLLRNKGIDVEFNKHMNHNEIKATTESIDAVLNLLKEELEARILKIQLREFKGFRNVDSIEFYVDSHIFFEKDWDPIEIVLETKEDSLNPNEIGLVYHNVKDLYSAYQSIGFMKETCVSLVKSHFTEICRTIGFEGKIFHEKDDKSKPIREKNQLIREKEAKLGLMMKDVVKDATSKTCNKIKKEVYELLNFDAREIKITPHQLSIRFAFATGPNFEKYEQLSDEKLYELYDTNNGTIDDEDLLILCSERNQKTLEEKLTHLYPGITITELDVQNHWSIKANSIKGFTVSLDNLNVLA